MEQIIADLILKYPQLAAFFVVIGVLRVVVKPLMSIVKAAVEQTPSTKDDAAVAAFEQSKLYKTLLFIIDWLFSLKPIKL